ncbi:hypothetical protein [Stenotrophomonas sp. S41]|uniref:hypothetical protein n=1 Tax=Stenotrophomonas sp. S41 TaxID=2767464 RepID=UPI00190E52B8|nr:hypothetical protein [Stenotrophomonas sp. S41]MBK0010809.1 hypothetical protein [Stenotrophomonas sp. S41]
MSWLLSHDAANPKLPATLLSHTAFFVALDRAFDSSERLLPQAMLDLFSVQGLRRHVLPLRFLAERVGLEITDEEKAEHVETCRIGAIIETVETKSCSEDFVRFNQWLILDGKPTRTRRLYISTAARLSQSLGWITLSQLDQNVVDRYLSKNPGTRNDLGATLRFARAELGCDIRLPPPRTRRVQEEKPVRQLRALLKKIELGGEASPIELFEKAVCVAMQISPAAIRSGKWWPEKRGGRWLVVSSTETINAPAELNDVIAGWMAARC